MKVLLFSLATAAVLSSCGLASLSVKVMRPADINVPQTIRKVAIANRSLSGKKTKFENIVEGVVTGEGVGMDKDGSEECVSGLVDILTRMDRFHAVRPAVELTGTGRETFPPPLDWNEVKRICKESNADALILLEVFDSDSKYQHKIGPVTSKNAEGQEITRDVSMVENSMRVTTGWRIYYPAEMRIIDEFKTSGYKKWNTSGSTEEEARGKLPPRRDAIRDCGFIAGNDYATRICPVYVWVSRSYYQRKHESLKRGRVYVRNNDWDGAAKEWKKVLESGNQKQKGCAAYNLAVASEVMGDLENALSWAQKSAYDFGNRKAPEYVRILKGRIADEERLKQQMGQ